MPETEQERFQRLAQELGYAPQDNTAPVPPPVVPGLNLIQQPGQIPQERPQFEVPRLDAGSVFNTLMNGAIGAIGGGKGLPGILGGIFGATNNQDFANKENLGNITQALLRNKFPGISAPRQVAISTAVPSAIRIAQDPSASNILASLGEVGANTALAKFGDSQRKGIASKGILKTTKDVEDVLKQAKPNLGKTTDPTDFGRQYKIYMEDLPKAQRAVELASKLPGAGNPKITQKIAENIAFNQGLKTKIGAKQYTLPELEARVTQFQEGLKNKKYSGGALAGVTRMLPEMESELNKLKSQVKPETIDIPNKHYAQYQAANKELERLRGMAKDPLDLEANNNEILRLVKEADANMPDNINREIFRKNPLAGVLQQDLEQLIPGSNQISGIKKQQALNRIGYITRIRPESLEDAQKLFVTNGLKDISPASIINGTADFERLNKTVKAMALDDDAIKVIFADDPERGRNLLGAIQKLPEALKTAQVTLNPNHLGGISIGSSGARTQLVSSLLDADAWVNAFKKKDIQAQTEIIKSLNMLSEPDKIKTFAPRESYPLVVSNLLRNLEQRLHTKYDSDKKQKEQQKLQQSTPAARIPVGIPQ
jgi:hypothetical protein